MHMRSLRALFGSALLTGAALTVTDVRADGGAVHVSLPFEKYTLANGLEVILHADHATPVVTVNIWYHVGSKDEPQGKNGFAHLFEHVMFQGSRDVPEDTYFKDLEGVGASDVNGSTNSDRTNYHETVPSNALTTALWLESDRMGFLLDHVNQETFASQRDVVKNERRQNYENAPYGLVYQFLRNAMYPASHPYHTITIGTPADLDAATLDDVKAFFKTYYLPNNATLVVAGDFDSAAVKPLVEKYFATIPRGADPQVKSAPMPVSLDSEKRLDVEADVELPRIVLAWPTPAEYTPEDEQLDITARVLAAGKSSRLYKRLVYDLQIAQDVSASQESGQLSSMFTILVTLKKGKDPAQALQIVDDELAKLRASGPTADDVAQASAPLVSGEVFALEHVSERADQFNRFNQIAHDPGFFDTHLSRYANASASDVQKAVSTWLPVGKRIVLVVKPTPGAPRAGRLVGGQQ
jgi:predicted Zn-dependent peptidase